MYKKNNFYLITIKTYLIKIIKAKPCLCIYFENKNEYKAEKFLYIKPKCEHINSRITFDVIFNLYLRLKIKVFCQHVKSIKILCFRPGFPKVGQVTFLGAMTDIQGATSSKGAIGGHGQ